MSKLALELESLLRQWTMLYLMGVVPDRFYPVTTAGRAAIRVDAARAVVDRINDLVHLLHADEWSVMADLYNELLRTGDPFCPPALWQLAENIPDFSCQETGAV